MLAVAARRPRLNPRSRSCPQTASSPHVRRLAFLRGVSTLIAFALLAVAIGGLHRFTGNSIGSFVDLVPSRYSAGASPV